jgi:hypothetical protein
MSSEPFDFEAFISGTQLARGQVGFYKVDHRPEIARLTREHDALAPEPGDDREVAQESPRKVLAARIAALREEMEASRVEFTIRTLTPDEFRRVSDDESLDIYDQLAMQAVEPELNRDQWKRLADHIGMAQFAQITKDANDLILSKVAVPDFSRSVSETLSPPLSSES